MVAVLSFLSGRYRFIPAANPRSDFNAPPAAFLRPGVAKTGNARVSQSPFLGARVFDFHESRDPLQHRFSAFRQKLRATRLQDRKTFHGQAVETRHFAFQAKPGPCSRDSRRPLSDGQRSES